MQDPGGVIELFLDVLQPELKHKGRLSAVEVTQLLHKAYLVRYSLATEEELKHNPAVLVKMRPAEDSYSGTMLEDHFDHFVELEIFHYMKWSEYISQPRHELEMIRRIAEKRRKKKNSSDANTARDLEKLANEMKST
jgi:hypothetical protein